MTTLSADSTQSARGFTCFTSYLLTEVSNWCGYNRTLSLAWHLLLSIGIYMPLVHTEKHQIENVIAIAYSTSPIFLDNSHEPFNI